MGDPHSDWHVSGLAGSKRIATSKQSRAQLLAIVLGCLIASSFLTTYAIFSTKEYKHEPLKRRPHNAQGILDRCSKLHDIPGPPEDFHIRTESDRFVVGTKPVLIRNATIWTGEASEVVHGDLLLDKGLIKAVGEVSGHVPSDAEVYDASGAWVTSGVVDMHSHIGVMSAPLLKGSADTNSHKGPILPWLRSLDGLNTHDEAFKLTVSGGVTTSLILPGSANSIGGQAFVIKLRHTEERSPISLLLEPPFNLALPANSSKGDGPLRWRQMKHACGENPDRVYSNTRMDTIWSFRQAYETARKIKQSQDDYCVRAEAGEWDGLGAFPNDLQWEALVDVLRGRVKVHNHCYETVDFAGMVGLTNEFNFSIAAFHHAHEAYLVPDLLKQAYGGPPAVAIFANNARYKRESYRGSPYAPKILADAGLSVVMKSDHPVLNSRHLIFEAQQAHYHGLSTELAMASVFSTPARIMGMDHRIGYLKQGYDADVVVWDSHPLAIGATPRQVFIDGIPQLSNPHHVPKPSSLQQAPKVPDFSREAEEAVKHDGLPPLSPVSETHSVIFQNVSHVFLRQGDRVEQVFSASAHDKPGAVVVRDGSIVCFGLQCSDNLLDHAYTRVDLHGGSISPGLVSYGSPLGLSEITGEIWTSDGPTSDPLQQNPPEILGSGSITKAQDGLLFSTRNAQLSHRAGVTSAIVAPTTAGFLSGISTYFSTGAKTALEERAVIQDTVGVHVTLSLGSADVSVSNQVDALRNLLLSKGVGERGEVFGSVTKGIATLVVNVNSVDIMSILIRLKREIEAITGTSIRMTFNGALEAHLIAKEIGEAGIGVILSPTRPYPAAWDARRILPGPPLTAESSVTLLRKHNVTVGLGVEGAWEAPLGRFYAASVGLEAGGDLTESDVLTLASTNIAKLVGVVEDRWPSDLVATAHGSLLDLESKVVAVVSGNGVQLY